MWVILFILLAAITIPKYIQFRHSQYRRISGHDFFQTSFFRQNYANYLTFQVLEKNISQASFLMNLYLPHPNRTTEYIPLVMITAKGIFVFESMTKHGIIYGNEYTRMWTQSFPHGNPQTFENPTHINLDRLEALQFTLNRHNNAIYYSFVVMEERSKLKDVTIYSQRTFVVNWGQLRIKLFDVFQREPNRLTVREQRKIYHTLQRYRYSHKSGKQAKVVTIEELRKENSEDTHLLKEAKGKR